MLTATPDTPAESFHSDDIPAGLSSHHPLNTIIGDTMPRDTNSSTTHNIVNTSVHSVDETTPCDIDNVISSDSEDGTTQNSVNSEALIQTPLQLGQTLIIYHPHAQHPPEIVNTNTLSLTREPQPLPLPEEPWAPFRSRDDFEQAELFIKHNCPNPMINDQLRLNQKRDLHHHGLGNPPLMKNACEMHKILEEAGSDLDISLVCKIYLYSMDPTKEEEFEKVDTEVPYAHGGIEEDRKYTIHCRSSLNAILDVIQDPDLYPSFTFYPERHYILNPRTNTNMRVWTDIHTGDDWWELQVCLKSLVLF